MYNLNQIPSEAQIRKCLKNIVFGRNIYCPECHSRHVCASQGRYRCKKCRIRFSLLSHTWLSNTKLPLQLFWLLLWCWTTQVPVLQTMALTKLSEKAVRTWFDKFRSNLPQNNEALEKLIQLDEAYFKNNSLFMCKQIGTRKLAFEVIPQPSVAREHAWFFLQSKVKPDSLVNTDGSAIYKNIENWWPINHQNVDIHKKFEFQNTSEIEGMFGVLRTFIRRMYHHVSGDKLPEYVGEFCFRFSHPEMFENPRYYLEMSLSLVPTR